jgi:serine protease Do
MNFFKTINNLLAILVIGGLGGVLADKLALPYLVYKFNLNKISWLRQIKETATVVNTTEKVVVADSAEVEGAIEKNRPAVVGVLTKRMSGAGKSKIEQIVAEGTGFIITSDGLLATASNLAPEIKGAQTIYYVVKDNKLIMAQLVKRDEANQLAILKIQDSNLSAVSFGGTENARLGQRLILIGAELIGDKLNNFINVGIIKNIASGAIITDIDKERGTMNGAAALNIKGEVVGMVLINPVGRVELVSASRIRDLINNISL